MRTQLSRVSMIVALVCLVAASDAPAWDLTAGFSTGKPEIQSISTLEFGPEALLFIGDSKAGAVFVVDTGDTKPHDVSERFTIGDIEGKAAAMLGTTPDDVLIHDMAVNPLSRVAYLSVSRGRGKWESKWWLPNDLADATVILRIDPDGNIDELALENVRYAQASLPNPVDMNATHRWKEGVPMRVDAITDIVYHDGRLYVAGLSNEEFASAMWQMDFPFAGEATWTTLEIFHGAHGKYETHAPIRTFLPYQIGGQSYILASYLCTPLVTFPVGDLANGRHLKGKTVGELGSGNYPLDIVSARHGDKQFIVLANSQLPLLTIDMNEIAKYNDMPGITRETPGYTEGTPYTPRAASGVLQLDAFTETHLLALQRMPSGKLDLVVLSVERLAM